MKSIIVISFISFACSLALEENRPRGYGIPSLLPLPAPDNRQPLEYRYRGSPILNRVTSSDDKEDAPSYPQYHFEYGVQDGETGDVKQQFEERDGEAVRGEYSLIEPDGTIRNVQYIDDGISGFNAIVTRSGQAVHPSNNIPSNVVLPVPVALRGYRPRP